LAASLASFLFAGCYHFAGFAINTAIRVISFWMIPKKMSGFFSGKRGLQKSSGTPAS
jgi:hypothetical protein